MLCVNCNNREAKVRFCSRSCSASFNNKKFPKRNTGTIKHCKQCNKKIENDKIFCSRLCMSQFKFETETCVRVEQGLVKQAETLKNYLIKKVGNKCIECDNMGVHNGKTLKLQLDHIDGNSDNNFPQNIRLLCPNCHSQTNTFCTRQKKDTRRNRYLRKYKSAS